MRSKSALVAGACVSSNSEPCLADFLGMKRCWVLVGGFSPFDRSRRGIQGNFFAIVHADHLPATEASRLRAMPLAQTDRGATVTLTEHNASN